MVDDTYDLGCHTKHSTFWIIFLVTKGAWLIFGTILTVLTRQIATDFNHPRSIGYSIYNIVVMLIIGVPLAIALENISGGVIIIEVGVIVVAFTFTSVSLFFDVWYSMIFHQDTFTLKMTNVRSSASNTTKGSSGSVRGSKNSNSHGSNSDSKSDHESPSHSNTQSHSQSQNKGSVYTL